MISFRQPSHCALVAGLWIYASVGHLSHAGDILRGGVTRADDASRVRSLSGVGQAQAVRLRSNAQDRLARTTQALQQFRAAQSAGRAAVTANNLGINPITGTVLSDVPDGLGPGGLDLDRVVYGADNPVQSGNNVTVKQNESQALLHWKTFNVGRNTTLNFDQSAGGADVTKWIAFNKVTGAELAPSQILGRINAQGQVYVLNQNGIIFGGSSQINTRALVASSLPINDNLLRQGLLNNKDAQFLFSTTALPGGGDGTPAFAPPAPPPGGRYGNVTVQRGALLRATVGENGDGGRVMLAAPNVANRGVIETPSGQTVLAAGLQVGVRAHPETDPSLRGLDVWIGQVGDYGGSAVNEGLIDAPTGSIVMAGRELRQAGVLNSATTVNLNGRIDLLASYGAVSNPNFDSASGSTRPPFLSQFTGTVELAPGSVTRIVPDDNGGARLPASRLSLGSVVNIEGRAIQFAPGSTVLAPSGRVAARAGRWPFVDTDGNGSALDATGADQAGLSAHLSGGAQKFLLEGGQVRVSSGALVDVSGSVDVAIPLSQHLLEVQMRGSELSDSPLLRDSSIRGLNLLVDLRRSGVYGGRAWVGTPLGDLTGFAAIIERGIAELTARGGDIDLAAGDAVVLEGGSLLDVSGGFLAHAGGRVQTTRLLRGRHLVDMHEAFPDRTYDGVYTGRATRTSSKWGVTREYAHALAPLGAHDQSPYFEGAAAGSVRLKAPTVIAAGEMRGESLTGPRQQESPAAAGLLALSFRGEKNVGTLASPVFIDSSPFAPNFLIAAGSPARAVPSYTLVAGEPESPPLSDRGTFVLGSVLFDEEEGGGFGRLEVDNPDGDFTLPGGTALALRPGSSVRVDARNVDILSSIVAPGGSLSFTAYNFSPLLYAELDATGALDLPPTPGFQPGRGIVAVGPGAALDVAGMMVDERITADGPLYRGRVLGGGTVSLEGYEVMLAAGSLIDASGGVHAAATGGYNYGDGGAISILSGRDPELPTTVGGRLVLNGVLQAYSFARGGSLSLQSNFIQIGGAASPAGGILLSPEFFRRGGFTEYNLIGLGGRDSSGAFIPAVRVAAGTVVEPAAMGWLHTPYGGLRARADFIEEFVLSNGGWAMPRTGDRGVLARAGIRHLDRDVFRPILHPAGLRESASISLTGLGFNDRFTGSSAVDERIEGLGLVVIERGARLSVDPGASVGLKGDSIVVHGEILAPGGTIDLNGRSSFRLPEILGPSASFALPTVYLGPSARLSTAGTSVLLPDPFGRRAGLLYPGGRISLSGNIFAEAGAVLDVSGASETLDFHPSRLGGAYAEVPLNAGLTSTPWGRRGVAVRVDSDGGYISLRGSQMLLSDATLLGGAGGPSALGGTLSVGSGRFYAPGESRSGADINMVVRQSGSAIQFADAGGTGALLAALYTSADPEGALGAAFAAGRTQPGIGFFAVDRFSGGGFDNLDLAYFYDDDASPIPFGGNVEFQGPVSINAAGSVRLAGGGIIKADSEVSVTAPYVAIGQAFRAPLHPDDPFVPFREFIAGTGATPQLFVPPTAGSGQLGIRSSLLDVGHLSLQGISSAVLRADGGDIRGSGSLNIAGSLTLAAGQIYPVTLAPFDIFAYDPGAGRPGSVSILKSGSASAPLSAGGRLRIFASSITQAGVLRAPFGSIALGWDGTDTDPSDADLDAPFNPVAGSLLSVPVAGTVDLLAGSVTSVSGNGLTVPFGLSPDGLTWVDPRGVDVTAAGLPQRALVIAGESVRASADAVVDLQGGGDLMAYRWIPGIGGSVDLLGTAERAWSTASAYSAGDLVLHDGRTWSARVDIDPRDFAVVPEPSASTYWSELPTAFAVVPGFSSGFAPFSLFNTGPNSGALGGDPGSPSAGLRLGEQIFLPGVAGLPAGSYTLLPRRYALLPGAFLVVPDEGSLGGSGSVVSTASPSSRTGLGASVNVRRPDGSYLLSGYTYNSFNRPAELSPLRPRFEVLPPDVLADRAAYEVYRATPFLAGAAERLGLDSVQALPRDAAPLAVHGNSGLSFLASVLAGGAGAGRSSSIDLSSFSDMYVTGNGAASPPVSAAVLDVGVLNSWNAGSLLIGGLRRPVSGGAVVDVRSGSVVLDSPQDALRAADVVLAAAGGLTLRDGASLEAAGSALLPAGRLFVEGDGALVRASASTDAAVARSGTTSSTTPRLVVGSGVAVRGGSATLDSSYASLVDPGVLLDVSALTLGSGQISVVLGAQPRPLAGAVVPEHLTLEGTLLASAASSETLRLQSYRTIDLYGEGSIGSAQLGRLELLAGGLRGYAGGGAGLRVSADQIFLSNPSGVETLADPAAATGPLLLEAGVFELGAGDFRIAGFSETRLQSAAGVLAVDDGTLAVGGSFVAATPVLAAGQGVSYLVDSSGALSFLPLPGVARVESGTGAKLRLAGSSVVFGTSVSLPGGSLDLAARSGDVLVSGQLRADGFSRTFFDVTRYADAGRIDLSSAAGSVLLAPGSVVSVSGHPGGGDAGVLSVRSPGAPFELGGDVLASARAGSRGGSFLLDAGSVSDFAGLVAGLQDAGFSERQDLRLRSGDVLLGGTTTVRDFNLSADDGSITVSGTIDASGQTGGSIGLAAARNLVLGETAVLTVAGREFSSAGRGGRIALEAGAAVNGSPDPAALLDLRVGSLIDLTVAAHMPGSHSLAGSSAFYGQFEGTLHLRAPRAGSDVGISAIGSTVRGGSAVSAEAFRIYQPAGGVMDRALRDTIHADNLAYISAAEAPVVSRLLSMGDPALATRFVFMPGVEIINRSGDLVLGLANPAGSSNLEALSDADWDLSAWRYGSRQAPGVLTLRSQGDLVFNNALSDGFTPIAKGSAGDFANSGHSRLWLAPLQSIVGTLPENLQSWSYRLASGADFAAADSARSLSTEALDLLQPGKGSVLVGEFFSAAVPNPTSTGAGAGVGRDGQTADTIRINNAANNTDRGTRYEVVRTGTGVIEVSAGRDVQLRNPFATIYTAGVSPTDPSAVFAAGDFSLPVTAPRRHPEQGGTLGIAQQNYGAYYGMAGGDIRVTAGRDIGRFARVGGELVADSSMQLPTHWLYRRGLIDPATGLFARIASTGLGAFSDPSASTTWWVDYSSFFQGFGALGGGRLRLAASRDIINADAAVPTSARMAGIDPAGGLNLAPDLANLRETGGGDISVVAGGNINGGTFYAERGSVSLAAGDEITSNEARGPAPGRLSSSALLDERAWQAVTLFGGRTSFDVTARGDLLLGPVAAAFLQPQGLNNKFWYKTQFQNIGESAGLEATSVGGDITHRLRVTLPTTGTVSALEAAYLQGAAASTASAGYYRPWLRLAESDVSDFRTMSTVGLPRLSSTAHGGDVVVAGELNLFPSRRGQLEIFADGSLQGLVPTGVIGGSGLTAWSSARLNLSDADPARMPSLSAPLGVQQTAGSTDFLAIRDLAPSSWTSLDPLFRETGSYTGDNGAIDVKSALHAATSPHLGNTEPVRVYAGSGDISGLTLFAPRKVSVLAGRDITDIAFYLQHTASSDISLVSAGRDIIPFNANSPRRVLASSAALGNVLADAVNDTVITGADGLPVATAALAGDIQIGGPGILEVLAARDLDLGTGPNFVDGTGTGLTSIGRLRNPYLAFEGAHLVTLAGVGARGGGPALGLSGSVLDFSGPLGSAAEGFLGTTDEHRAVGALRELFAELKSVGAAAALSGDYGRGYELVDEIFGDAAGPGSVYTRARDIRTSSGGSITVAAPGGGLTMASDIFGNPLTPPGIVTQYGGEVYVLTDGDVDIGRARIFTLRGGDLTIWSSSGDIAAGTAPKTVVTAPPTRVLIDATSADIRTDLGGLATGGGIGVLAAVSSVEPGSVTLLAPEGTVDAGDAGIRATGDITIAAAQVVNADNIAAGGASVGVPSAPAAAAPNVAGLSSASSSTAAASSAASDVAGQSQAAGTATQETPSLITVEVLGYGGGEEEEEEEEREARLDGEANPDTF